MIINKALLKYEYSKFKLEILEYCDSKEVSKREQFYINNLNPSYNILKIAYSSLGYKHTKEVLVKIKKNLTHLNKSKRIKVKVTNLETNDPQEYDSLTDACKNLLISKTTIKKYILNCIPFKKIYKIESNISVSSYDSNYVNHPNSLKIEVIDLKLNIITNYDSIRAASRALDIG
jgi:hypothetical protein